MGATLGHLGAALGAVTVDAHGSTQPLGENLFADLPDSFVTPRAPSLHVAFLLQDGAGRCLKYAGRNRVTEMVDACAPADAALLWAYDPETRQVQLANDTVTCLDLFDVNSGGGREALGAYWCHGGPNQQFLPAYGDTGLCSYRDRFCARKLAPGDAAAGSWDHLRGGARAAPPGGGGGSCDADLYDEASCAEWAAGGECAINPRFMHRQCRRSCSRAEFGRTCDTREQSAWPREVHASAGVARPRDADFGNATIDLPEHA